jgi:hypothetical protein
MTEEQTETTESTEADYEVVKDASIERFFSYELELDEEGFFYDDDENLLGAVVHFDEYPTHETLISIFDDLLLKAVMQTQEVDEDEASEMIEACDDEEDYEEELDVSQSFSLLFKVEGYRGLYRMLTESGDYWIGHSTGCKGDRWEY